MAERGIHAGWLRGYEHTWILLWNMATLITRTGNFYITYAELAHLHTGGPVAYRLNPYVTVPR